MADVKFCEIRYGSNRGALTGDTGNTTVTLSQGVTPSAFTFEVVQPSSFVPKVADVFIIENGKTVAIFRECAIDGIYRNDGDDEIFTVKILDRRWKWWRGGGTINLIANRRKADKKIDEDTKKTPQELVKLLLEEMKERNLDYSVIPKNVPDDELPEIEWEYMEPVAALQELCDRYGCRVCPTLNDRFKIAKMGVGRSLTNDGVIEESDALESVAVPDSLLFVGGRTQWQGLLKLEPVGIDLDEKIKPLKELSYLPDGGFQSYSAEYPERAVSYGTGEEEKEKAISYAKMSIWKWYRVAGQPNGKLGPVPKYDGEVKHLWQYEIQAKLLDSEVNDDGQITLVDPQVFGQWIDSDLGYAELPNIPPGCTKLNTRYKYPFSIDVKNQTVKFSQAVYTTDHAGNLKAPDLYLLCAYFIRQVKTRIPHRSTIQKNLPVKPTGTGPMPVKVPDVFSTVRISYKHTVRGRKSVYEVKEVKNNNPEVKKAANAFLDAKRDELVVKRGQDQTKEGFVAIEPDGRIQQVTWWLSNGIGKTRASTNSEHSRIVPEYKQRVNIVKTSELASEMKSVKEQLKKF